MSHLDEIFRIQGKNLFDGGEHGSYDSTTGEKIVNNTKYRSKNKIPVVAGQTYSNNIIDKPSWLTVSTLNIYGYDAQGAFLWSGTTSINAWSIGRPFTMPENTAYITVSTFGTDVNSDERVAELNEKFMIVEGSVAPTEYSPYAGEFKTIGNIWERAIPTSISKANLVQLNPTRIVKNLFNKNNRTRIFGYFASSGTTWAYNASAYSNKLPCKPNTAYTARYNGNSTQAVLGFGSCSTDVEPSASIGNVTVTQGIRQNSPTLNTPVTITTGPNDKWLIVAYNVAEPQHSDMANNLQIEEAATATPLYPFFSPQTVLSSLKAFGATPVKRKQDKLWSRYVPCEYIESSSRQYIDTGIIADNNTEVELDYAIFSNGSVYIFGTRIGSPQYFTISGSQTGGTNTNFVNGTSANVNVGNRVGDVWNRLYQKVSTNNGTVNWNATNKDTQVSNSGTYNATIPTLETTLRLFSNSTDYEQHGRIYSCKLKQNNTLVRDFIPVKDTINNVYGMWDRVTETFYGNAGTGAFTGGELIQPIAYAESDGMAYADTGIIPTTFDYTVTYEGAIEKLSAGPNCAWGYMGGSGNLPRWVCAGYSNNYLLNANTTAAIQGADTNSHVFVGKVYESNGAAKWLSEIDGVVKQNDQTLPNADTWTGNTLSIYLFARHNADGAGNFGVGTLKRWICEKAGVEICHIIPVRIGTTVELLDLVSWTFATRTGTFTAGADIPYSQLCPEILKVNTGDLKYGLYSSNMFDKATVKAGYYLNDSGTEVTNSKWNISNYMLVTGGETYYQTINTPGTAPKTCWYDANKIFLSAVAQVAGGTLTAPANAKYCRMSVWEDDLNRAMFTHGADAPTEYEPYKFGLHTDGSHKLRIEDEDGNVIERDIPTLYSADSFIDTQVDSSNKSEEWACIWYDSTQTVPSGYISEYGDLRPNQIVLYPLATPVVSTHAIAKVELTEKATYTVTAQAELPVTNQATYLGLG